LLFLEKFNKELNNLGGFLSSLLGGERGNILDLVFHAGLVVKIVLLILLTFSIVSWAIIFYKFRLIGRAKKESEVFVRLFRRSKRLDAVFNPSKNLLSSPLANIFRAGYLELTAKPEVASNPDSSDLPAISTDLGGIDNIKRTLRMATASEVTRLERALPFLATTASTAPFIGLFGTVWGIMDSFRGIGVTGSASLAIVAPGIAEALVATAAGLAAAIPAVVAYNYYINRIRILVTETENFSQEFLNIIERKYFNGPRKTG
jgi:biopolymer transport protein TolQ